MSKITKRRLAAIVAQTERAVSSAFTQVLSGIRSGVNVNELERLIASGNLDAVINYLQVDPSAWQPLTESVRASYVRGGETGAEQLGRINTDDGLFVARFDLRNIRAEEWVAKNSSRLAVELSQAQRAMLSNVLTVNIERGVNPRTSALDLVGRVSSATRQRVGGFIGLTDAQADWVIGARAKLDALDTRYFSMELRDRRFDRVIARHIADGTPIPDDLINRAVTSYQSRAQRYRGSVIARTESLNGLRAGQWEAIEQAVENLEIDRSETVKIWDATGDSDTRPDHMAMNGVGVPVDQPFILPDNSEMMYPGDGDLGAPPEQVIQCRCSISYEVNFGAVSRKMEGF